MIVHWTDRAKARLRDIETYLVEESGNPEGVKVVIERLLRRSWQIAEQPESGRKVPGYEALGLREILEHPYRIIYNIKPDQADVITVMHYRQLLPTDLKSFITGP